MSTLKTAVMAVAEYLKLRQEPKSADAIFILGGSSLAPVEMAASLYHAGYAPKVVFISVGGRFGGEKIWGMLENQKYKEVLLAAGVPEDAIITEGLTTNTLAEAKQAIPFMRNHGLDPRTLILVSRPFHQRRALATFSQQHPSVEYVNCPGDESLDVIDVETQERMVQEAERLLDYSTKGDITRQPMSKEILSAVVIIRRHLKETGVYRPRERPRQPKT